MKRTDDDDGEVELTNNNGANGGASAEVESVHGVGPKFGERLREVGIETIEELADRTARAVSSATEGGVPEGKASNIINKAQKRAILEANVGPDMKDDWGAELAKTRVAMVWPDHYDSRDEDELLGKVAMAIMESPWDPDVVQLQKGWGSTATSIKQWVDKQARDGELVGALNFNPRWQDIPRDAELDEVEVQTDHDEWKHQGHRNTLAGVLTTQIGGLESMDQEQLEEQYGTWGNFLDEVGVEIDEDVANEWGLYYRMAAKRRDEELLENADGVIILAGDENTEYTRRAAERMEKEVFQFKDGRRGSRTIDGSERTANSGEEFDATEDETEGEVGGPDWAEFNDYEDDDEGPGGDGDPTSGKKEFTSGQY